MTHDREIRKFRTSGPRKSVLPLAFGLALLITGLVAGASSVALAQQAKTPPTAPAPAPTATTAGGPAPSSAAAPRPAATTPQQAPARPVAAPAAPAAGTSTTTGTVAPPSAAGGTPPASTVAAAAAPKPAPELEQMKVLEGSWRCDGRAPAGPSGPEHAYKSTWKFKRDLDNFWWAAEYQQSKAKNNPMPMKARGYLTYDNTTKSFMLVGVDNMGGSSTESTSGWSGDVVTLAGDASLAGRKVPYREIITKKGNREFTWRGELKMGGDWVTLGEDRCKK